MADLTWLVAPTVACLLMVGALGWFGLHVLQRGVIFVDLALAQVAALGTTWAVFLGHEPDAPLAYATALVFTAIGSVAFAVARHFEDRVPQEAIIGIAYAVSAGAGALVIELASDPHGAEKLQHLMVGNVVWVTWTEIAAMAAVITVVGLGSFLARRPLLLVSFEPERASRELHVALWDLAFYLGFGLVITAVVHVAGVLLIFSLLIIPAVIARLFVDGVGPRLATGWAIGALVSVGGVAVSYSVSAGPVIVTLLGFTLLASLGGWAVWRSKARAATAGRLVGALAVTAAAVGGFALVPEPHEHEEHEHEHVGHDHDEHAELDPVQREAAYRNADRSSLLAALDTETDESLRLLIGSALTRAGERKGLDVLAATCASDVPFLRLEAHDRLALIAGDDAPAYDPFEGPDTGAWAAWVAGAEGWEVGARQVTLP